MTATLRPLVEFRRVHKNPCLITISTSNDPAIEHLAFGELDTTRPRCLLFATVFATNVASNERMVPYEKITPNRRKFSILGAWIFAILLKITAVDVCVANIFIDEYS